jgi:hypothetical protein
MNGIWGKTELPALRDKTDVEEVSSFSAPITPSIACFPAIWPRVWQMMKISEDTKLSTKWLLLDKGHPTVVRTAIEEIKNIFRVVGSPSSGRADSNSQACELWAIRKGSYLDQAM